jgi:hypothetical protein
VEKASLECRLTDLCLHMHQDPARAVRHAELAVALSPPDRQDVLANASAGLVVAYFEAGERTKAVGLATSVLASPGAGTLSYGRRRDVEWIARHGEE